MEFVEYIKSAFKLINSLKYYFIRFADSDVYTFII